MPDLAATDARATDLERRVDRIEPRLDTLQTDVTGLKADMVHVVEGAGRIGVSLEKLADAMNAKLVSDGAANAVVSNDLSHLKAGISAITVAQASASSASAALRWPPSAKAMIYAGGLALIGQIGAVLLGHPL